MDSGNLKNRLHTRLEIQTNPVVRINSSLFFIGSCFSENIGNLLGELFISSTINPFGIIYSPIAIATAMDKIGTNHQYTETDLFFHNGNFVSLDHHGSYQNPEAQKILNRINTDIQNGNTALKNCDVAFVTLGTAFAYRHILTNKIVANCHRIPNTEFEKIMHSESELINAYTKIVNAIKRVNSQTKIVFTISPVKHLRDGILENAQSKARLASSLAAYTYSNTDVSYFPAYEIMTEELRDHRFYKDDLAHPSAWSLQYIFTRLIETVFDLQTRDYINDALKYYSMRQHRPMQTNADELAKWELSKANYFVGLQEKYPDKPWVELLQ